MKFSALDQQKNILRLRLRQKLMRLTRSERERKSRRILEKLMKGKSFQNAHRIFTYVSLPLEVQTLSLIQEMFVQRKRVFVPAVHPKKKEISLFEIWDLKKDLKKGRFGILEPVRKRPAKVETVDLFIIPGIGFERKGTRLGRGEGYFDRFLKRVKKAPKIGLAFREQIVKKIPSAAHDVPVDQVITD